MGKLLSFPKHHDKYSGSMLQGMMQRVCHMVDIPYARVTLNSVPARGLQDRCGLDVPVIGDTTGVMGVTCNAPMLFRCVHCGPLCVNCLEEFGCSGPNGKHEEDILEDGA